MKWNISFLLLMMMMLILSCTRDHIDKNIDYAGDVMISERNFANPPQDMEVITVYDTQYAHVNVTIEGNNILFSSDNQHLPNHSALINDSVGDGLYSISTYRPFSYYQFKGDTLIYSWSASDPMGGPYSRRIGFKGLKR